jgi:hypothetical protein
MAVAISWFWRRTPSLLITALLTHFDVIPSKVHDQLDQITRLRITLQPNPETAERI